jgi:drug/metabolite transporter (DMT)-like permease
VLILLNWTSTATLSAATYGVVSIVDSHLLSKRMPGLRAFLLPVGIIQLIFCLLVFYLFPLPEGSGALPILAAVAGGIFRTAGSLILFYNLKKEEVSRVIPITFTYPIFVAIIAIPFLGESLHYLQWLAIIIVVAGAVIISAERSHAGSPISLSKPFLLLFVASLFMALGDIFSKYALSYLKFWNIYSLSLLCLSLISLMVSIRPSTIKQLRDTTQLKSALVMLFFSEVLVMVGTALQFWAMARGPVSLVSTISSTRPFFVAIYSIILGFILPGFLIRRVSSRVMAVRFIAIAMIIGGISIIYLT